MGESWNNAHHADPSCARHGVLRGQIDIPAKVIWMLERLGWISDVRWTNPARLARITKDGTAPDRSPVERTLELTS
jgi:stearoyl-CoA desaturase (Delta-9 desaturase)